MPWVRSAGQKNLEPLGSLPRGSGTCISCVSTERQMLVMDLWGQLNSALEGPGLENGLSAERVTWSKLPPCLHATLPHTDVN